MYDAVFLASDELMQKQQGRKALILLTDGVDTGSKVSLDRAIETAQRADTLVYSILFADPEPTGTRAIPVMRHGRRHGGMGHPGGGMGRWPGGGRWISADSSRIPTARRFWSALPAKPAAASSKCPRKQPIDQIYDPDRTRNCATSTASATHPDKAVAGPGITRSRLTTTNKDLIVQTREGYYAQP